MDIDIEIVAGCMSRNGYCSVPSEIQQLANYGEACRQGRHCGQVPSVVWNNTGRFCIKQGTSITLDKICIGCDISQVLGLLVRGIEAQKLEGEGFADQS